MRQEEQDKRDCEAILNVRGTLGEEQKQQIKQGHDGYKFLAKETCLEEARIRALLNREPVSEQLMELKRELGIQ